MLKTYRTRAGDMFDLIAYQQLGSCRHVEKLIDANRQHVATTVFKAGVELTLPEIEKTRRVSLPPWRTET